MPPTDARQERISKSPTAVREAHAHSSQHRAEVLASETRGCFYCCATFPPSTATKWVDADADGIGQTALCPNCRIDIVIGDESGHASSPELLTAMNACWF